MNDCLISYAQNFEDVMLYRAFKNIKEGFYIDVGANDPEGDSVTKAFYDRGWHGINIEPETRFFEELQKIRTRDINLDIAVSDQEGDMEIYIFEKRGWSTGNKEVALTHGKEGHPYRIETIQTSTLDRICAEHNVKEVHFLKIDVEGGEKSVLKSFSFSDIRPRIVLIEATQPNTSVDVSSEWEYILLEHNYGFAYFDGINKYYIANEYPSLYDAFRSPPNVLDHYMTAAQYKAIQQADFYKKELAATQKTIKELLLGKEKSIALQNDYQTLQKRYNGLVRSYSCKITKPLRLLKSFFYKNAFQKTQ